MTDQPFQLVWPAGKNHPTDYQAKSGPISGVELLKMVAVATRAVLPELTRNVKSSFIGRRDKAVDVHVREWGALIAKKHSSSAYVGAQEPDAPDMGNTASGFTVNYAYWVRGGSFKAWSYPMIAGKVRTEGLATGGVRAWFIGLKKGGSELTRLIGEVTFGAEVGRNPRAFASHLMMYDLLESGGAPREYPSGLTVSMAELYDMPNNKQEIHGALPMMGQETYAQGRLGVSPDNPVNRKEAIAISAWLNRLQGAGKPFSRDQIYELLLRRLSGFGDIRSIAVPTEEEAGGREKAVLLSNQQADAEEQADRAAEAKREALRAAEVDLKREQNQLDQARSELQKEKVQQPPNENRVQLRSMAVTTYQNRVDQATARLQQLTAEAQQGPQPANVAPTPIAAAPPQPAAVVQPPAQTGRDTATGDESLKRKRETEVTDTSNKEQKTENK